MIHTVAYAVLAGLGALGAAWLPRRLPLTLRGHLPAVACAVPAGVAAGWLLADLVPGRAGTVGSAIAAVAVAAAAAVLARARGSAGTAAIAVIGTAAALRLYDLPDAGVQVDQQVSVLNDAAILARGLVASATALDPRQAPGLPLAVAALGGTPTESVLRGALLAAGAGLLEVALLVVVTRRLFGPVAGLVAGSLLALSGLAVAAGRVGVPATLGSALLLASLALVLEAAQRRSLALYIAAGLVAGLAADVVYSAWIAVLPAAAIAVVDAVPSRRRPASRLTAHGAVLMALAAWFTWTPWALLLQVGGRLHQVVDAPDAVGAGGRLAAGLASLTAYGFVLLLPLALAGIAVAARRRERLAVAPAVLAAAALAPALRPGATPLDFYPALAPLLALAAAALVAGAGRVRERLRGPVPAVVAVAGLAIAAQLPAAFVMLTTRAGGYARAVERVTAGTSAAVVLVAAGPEFGHYAGRAQFHPLAAGNDGAEVLAAPGPKLLVVDAGPSGAPGRRVLAGEPGRWTHVASIPNRRYPLDDPAGPWDRLDIYSAG